MNTEPQNLPREDRAFHVFPHPPRLALGALSLFLLVLSFNYIFDTYRIYQSVQAAEKTITISAEGKVRAIPDLATMSFSVITEHKDSKAAEAENTGKVNAILDFITSRGVDTKDVKTSQYSLTPQYYYPYQYPHTPCPRASEVVSPKSFSCPPKFPLIIGYEITQSITVQVRNFGILGELVSGTILRGANQVGNVSFSIEDPDKLKNEARKLAIESAKAKAEDLAKTAGVSLGRVVSFSEGTIYVPQPYYSRLGDVAAESAGGSKVSPPRFEAGSEDVQVSMSVIFALR